jgi:FkbM family methyltransferase
MKLISWSLNVVSGRQLVAHFFRRKIWKLVFEPFQKTLGPFFLDAQDHIGMERIITGEIYEGKTLIVLEKIITRLGLGDGIALDVGANIGNHTCWFAQHFYNVHSFEPSTVAALILQANVISSGYQNVVIHQCALGRRKSGGHLNKISIKNLGSSTVTESSEFADFMIYRGDDYWSSLNIDDKVELIKIDVEGFELEVIRGFSSLLSEHLPLLCVEVLKEENWKILRKDLVDAGYTSWFVVTQGQDKNSFFEKFKELIRGRKYCLSQIPEIFPTGGYDMIICMSLFHENKFSNH